jgi:hypothetical protein
MGDSDTTRIARAVEKMRSGEHEPPPCSEHEHRLNRLETVLDEHGRRLNLGDQGFVELRKDVASLTEKVGELTDAIKGAVRWILGTVGLIVAGVIVWAIAHGAVPL